MRTSKALAVLLVAGLSVIQTCTLLAASTETEKVLYSFTYHSDGGDPLTSGVIFDAQGNLYGVAYGSGLFPGGLCCGVVYELTPGTDGWNYRVIYTFKGPVVDGEAPSASLISDASGNLYGTTTNGGWCGTAYELSPAKGGEWTETVIHNFNPTVVGGMPGDGCVPSSSLVFDRAGNLYGTTTQGGESVTTCPSGCGSAFELSPTGDGKWQETIIHSFGASGDGTGPYGALVLDRAGNLWGTTEGGGTAGAGTVFELTLSAAGTWNERVAFSFTGNSTGFNPIAGLTIDQAGHLYGTTYLGGANDGGAVFELIPRAGAQLTERLLHQFAACNQSECPDGFGPFGGLVFDGKGSLYGTTTFGGGAGEVCVSESGIKEGCGVIFKLAPGTNGAWSYSIVYRFPGGTQGAYLTDDHLTVDPHGNIFGTTLLGGDIGQNSLCPLEVFPIGGCGVVFEITP